MSSSDCRVLILTDDPLGGMAHYAANLSRSMEKYCWSAVHVVGRDDYLAVTPWWARLVDRVRAFRGLRRFYNPYRGRRIARAVLNRFHPTVVHVTASGVPCMHSLTTELRRHGVLVVYTMHDPVAHHAYRTIAGRIHTYIVERWLTGRVLALFDLIHVHSKSHAADLTEGFPELHIERIYIVQHGGGVTPEVAMGSEEPVEVAGNMNYVLFFGRIEPYKGLSGLLTAVRILVTKYPRLRLVVAGAGHIGTIPEEIVSNVVLINRFIDDGEIKAIFSKADFVVLPYLEGTQTGVIPLASAFAVPAVATRVGALPELIEHEETGLVVDPGDPKALAAAMERMIAAPAETRLMGNAAQAYMRAHYDWSVVAEDHYRHYTAVRPNGRQT